jgi:hypothetical protein
VDSGQFDKTIEQRVMVQQILAHTSDPGMKTFASIRPVIVGIGVQAAFNTIPRRIAHVLFAQRTAHPLTSNAIFKCKRKQDSIRDYALNAWLRKSPQRF